MSANKEKYSSAVVDTINQAMNDTYVEYQHEYGRPGFDIWRDYSVEVLYFYQFVRSLPGAVLVQVLGREGTGKTVGAGFLDPDATMYLNIDRKPLTFADAEDKYPNDVAQGVSNSRGNYKEVLPKKNDKGKVEIWTPIRAAIQYAYDNRIRNSDPKKDKFVVFVLAHTEVFKGADGVERERLLTLGKQATKLNIEGSLVYCFYTKVDPTAPVRADKYKLTMHNSGFNTARVPMGKFDEIEEMANNYKIILDKILGS